MAKREDLSKSQSSSEGACGQDTIERERAERMLSESEQRFRSLVEETSVGVAIIDLTGAFTYVNGALAELLGYSVAELRGRQFSEFLHPDDIENVMKLFLKGISSPIEAETIEFRVTRGDGRILHLMSKPTRYTIDGKTVGFQAIIIDITERKRAEMALKESEERYRLLVESSPIGIGLASPDGKVISANQAMQTITGYTAEELNRISLADTYVNSENRRKLLEAMDQDGKVSNYHVLLRRKDGTPYDALLSISRIHIGDSDLFQTTCVDMTEGERMEQVLRDSEEQYRELADSITDVFFAMDKNLRYTYWNKASVDLTGISAKDAIGKSLHEVFPDVKRTRIEELYLEVLRTGQSRSFVTEFKLHGRQFFFEINAYPTRWGISVFVKDITERKRMEEEIRGLARFPSENPNPILRLNRDGAILVANPASKLLLQEWGSGIGQVAPKSWRDLATDALSTGQSRNIDVEFGGRLYTFLVKPTMEAGYVNLYGRDITERKQMEDELRRERDRAQTYLDVTGVMMLTIDAEGQITLINRKGCEILGCSAQEAVGKNWVDNFLPPVARDEVKAAWKSIMEGKPEQVEYHENSILTSRGEKRVMAWQNAPLKDAEGRIIGILSSGNDITERKRMEDELHRYSTELEGLVFKRTKKLVESERRFRELSDLLPQIVFEVDENGNVQYMNRAGYAAIGLSEEESTGLNAFRFLGPAEHDRATRGIRRVIAGEMIGEREFTVLRRDGTRFPALVYTAPITREGKTVGLRGIAIDITERKRMEQKLQDSEERFRGIAERSVDGIFELDLEGRVTYVSPSVEPELGYKPEEVIGTRMERYLPESEIPKIASNMAALMNGMNVLGLQGEMLHKDGTHVAAELNASPILRDGKIVGVQGIVRNITERKRAEEELRVAAERLDFLIKSNPAVIYSGKPLEDLSDWYLTYVSDRVVSMLGFEPQEFIGDPEFWTSHVLPEDLPRTLAAVPRLWKEGQHTFEYRFLHKDGTYRWIREEAQVVRDAAGKPVEVMGYWIDVTERKRMEEEIRASKERLEYIVASNPAVIFTGKPFSDHTDFDFTYVSSNITSMLGYDARDFIDDPRFWSKHVHPEDKQRVAAEIPRVFMEDHLNLEYRFRHKDGRYRWIWEENRLMRDKERRPQEVIGYWTDVTEWKRMEAELVKSQRLVTIGQTTAMVGHDLRNPLQAISGSLHVLRKQFENIPECQQNQAEETEALQMLDMIEESVGYMNKIVSDLQNYAAPLHPELATFSIDKLLNETLSTIRIPPGVKVSLSVQEGFQSLTVDPALMKRVFTNLAMNAVQAMPHGGELVITAQESGENALISFSDTGAGIAEEDLARLFEPFFTTKARGQGLGLSVCKRLIEAHGGNIIVDSTVRKGSTFTVRLPVSKSETS